MPSDPKPLQPISPLPAEALVTPCDPAALGFRTTAELPRSDLVVGQSRALKALDFGVRIRNDGYNLFVMGRPGSQRHQIVEEFLKQHSSGHGKARDWCYLNNFEDERKPVAVSLPAGQGRKLRSDARQLIDDLRGAIPAIFEGEQHGSAIAEINQEFEDKVRASMEELQEKARASDLNLISTPQGFAIAPMRDGKLISDEDFEKLSEDEKKRKNEAMQAMSDEMRRHVEQLPKWQKERRDKIKSLQRELVGLAVDQLIAQASAAYTEFAALRDYFDRLREDVIEHAGMFLMEEGAAVGPQGVAPDDALDRYAVNLLIDRSDDDQPPIVFESNPSIANLLGRIDHEAKFGALTTNFTMILPGALHKANGGYLILDADRVLTEPMAWSALKRTLAAREITIESVGQLLSLVSTVSLEPDSIPVDLKVILIGDRRLYYLLSAYDPEFSELFKVAVDFEDRVDRSDENVQQYAQLVGNLAQREGLRPLTSAAVARTIEHTARMQGDSQKLTTRLREVADVVREANFWADQDGVGTIDRPQVQKALDAQVLRLDRVRAEIQEEILRSTVLIDTAGAKAGQINGLAVLEIGNYRFGKPSRITATVRVGDGKIIDIERETDLGGPIHSKGVLILSSYLRARYATDVPLSIGASLVFEQSYSGVEGDSASIAETCALLSAIAEVPIRQSLAVTGSVNQHGSTQVIGGVNEKIEGFFDICRARGLTGEHGVLIPKDNVKHLMLRDDVVDAAAQGQFSVYPVDTIDEAIELLTGLPAGERDEAGRFPPDTVNYRVEKRLRDLARLRRTFDREEKGQRFSRDSGRRRTTGGDAR